MEKKYLEVYQNGLLIGAFENVREFREDENSVRFTSDDGSFIYTKGEDGKYTCDENNIVFDKYRLIGRRTLRRHSADFRNGRSVDINDVNNYTNYENDINLKEIAEENHCTEYQELLDEVGVYGAATSIEETAEVLFENGYFKKEETYFKCYFDHIEVECNGEDEGKFYIMNGRLYYYEEDED